MKQHEAVIQTLKRLGGVATLGQLYQETLKINDCLWKTKTPNESIRRIVQTRPNEIYKIKPGLYGVVSMRQQIEAKGIIEETPVNKNSNEVKYFNHYYYQGLLLMLGNLKNHKTFAPQQDKNKLFLGKKLSEIRNLSSIPTFSYPEIVTRSATIDVIWFNQRKMPDSFFEVESTTDIQNSLGKFNDLIDFNAKMFIVADKSRRTEFETKKARAMFHPIHQRVLFLDYDSLVKQYEIAMAYQNFEVKI